MNSEQHTKKIVHVQLLLLEAPLLRSNSSCYFHIFSFFLSLSRLLSFITTLFYIVLCCSSSIHFGEFLIISLHQSSTPHREWVRSCESFFKTFSRFQQGAVNGSCNQTQYLFWGHSRMKRILIKFHLHLCCLTNRDERSHTFCKKPKENNEKWFTMLTKHWWNIEKNAGCDHRCISLRDE